MNIPLLQVKTEDSSQALKLAIIIKMTVKHRMQAVYPKYYICKAAK